MAIFPSVEHRVYKYTFLLNTFTTLHFEKRDEQNCGADVKKRMKDFLIDNFNTGGQHNYPAESLEVVSDDHVIRYVFSAAFASVRVGRPQYTTFGRSMSQHALRLRRFASKVLGLDSVEQVDVRKVSLFPMLVEGETPTAQHAKEMMGKVLSEDVLSLVTIEEINGIPNSLGPFRRHLMEDKETRFVYEILTGVINDSRRENGYSVILDARCLFRSEEGINLANVEDLQNDMSRSLYDLFHWAVRPHIINAMKEGVING